MRPTTAPNPTDNDEVTKLRTRVRDLELALGQRAEHLTGAFRLPPSSNNILGLLLSVPTVTPEMIRQRLEIAAEAKVAVWRLRRDLAKWGIKISHRRGVGYWLEDEDKIRIRELVRQKLADSNVQITPQVIVDNAISNDEDVDLGELLDANEGE